MLKRLYILASISTSACASGTHYIDVRPVLVAQPHGPCKLEIYKNSGELIVSVESEDVCDILIREKVKRGDQWL